MIKVGITGGIGSGKTTVSSIFQELGVPVYNSDIRAKWLMVNHTELKLELLFAFFYLDEKIVLLGFVLRQLG